MDSVCCRLCGLNSTDLVEIFGEQGVIADYARKIGRYLYLHVTPTDGLPKSLCWMCSQQLETFHQFHEMIHGIQRQMLQERYSEYAIEVHQEYVEDEKIEIFDQLVKEENVLSDSYQPELQAQFPIIGSYSQAARQHDADDELISNDKDSIVVIKTEQAVETHQPVEKHNDYYDSGNNEEQIIAQQNTKTSKRFNIKSEGETQQNSPKAARVVSRKSTRKKTQNAPYVEISEDHAEGEESGDGLSSRNCENEEWPAAETRDKFPTTIIKNGSLTMKGEELMDLTDKFYNLHCDLCTGQPKGFKSVQELFVHYQSSHQQEGHVTCCKKKIYLFPSIFLHMARHIQPEAFKCDICGYLVTRPRFLITHRQSHLPDDQKPYACEHCPKRFCDERTYVRHLNIHKPPEERVFHVCAECGKRYATSSGLALHKRNAHLRNFRNTRVSHFCEICAKTFIHSSTLKYHIAKCHQQREKSQVQCTECSKWYMNELCLKVHMQLHNKEDAACDLCDYKTKKLSVLKRHKITKHQNEKPFSCEKCDNSFKHRQALTAHMRAKHNDGTCFKCNFCDRSFTVATIFYAHRKNRHPKELAALKEQAEAQRKLQRIKAGVEPDDVPLKHESTVTTTADGTRIITISDKNDGISDSSGTMGGCIQK